MIETIDCVFGGCGFIGSHLVEALLAQGRKVHVFDIQPWKYGHHDNLDVINLDIRKPIVYSFGRYDRVFHLAALSDIVPSIEHPVEYYNTNVTGTLNILEACKRYGVERFVYAASSSCYGMATNILKMDGTYGYKAIGENERLDGVIFPNFCPQYPYALTKYLGEQLVIHWAKVYKLPAISMRLFNVYGPRARTNGAYGAVFGVFLAQLANKSPLTVVGDGTQKRDFTYVTDVVDALIKAADSDIQGIYNVGSSNPVSINSIVEMLGSPEVAFVPSRPGEPDITHADISKIQRDLGWKPKVGIEEGIKILLENIESYRDAKVWTPETITQATKEWMLCLSST